MIIDIIKVIGPGILIMVGFYLYIDKKTKEKIEEFHKEKELLEKFKKENEDTFEIEFNEDFLSEIERHVKKNEEKYKPKKENENNIELFKIYTEVKKENKNYYELRKENEKKGREFELKVKQYFENLGYEVIDNAGIKGKKDEGIDLIAINKGISEYLCIQCKNWQKRKINHNHIKQFLSDYILYLKKNKNKVTVYKKRKFILAIPDKILTKAAYARIKENKEIIDFKIIY